MDAAAYRLLIETPDDGSGASCEKASAPGPMRKNTQSDVTDAASSEQRRLPRKNVLLAGVIVDAKGESASECTIRDMHAHGAAVSLPGQLQVGAHVYLLDSANGTAHEARVVWSKAHRSGLSFIRSHTMGLGLPPGLKFLWRLLFEAKLRQAERAVATGVSGELALGTAGLTRERIHQMARQAMPDKKLPLLLQRARRLLEK